METRIVVADFSKNSNIEFYNEIMSKVSDLDIGLVVLNAGVLNSGYFSKAEANDLQQLLDVNVY